MTDKKLACKQLAKVRRIYADIAKLEKRMTHESDEYKKRMASMETLHRGYYADLVEILGKGGKKVEYKRK